ncbi:MAG: SCP2 sterol-binding domain-containing protein [Pseudomonadota bacterium]
MSDVVAKAVDVLKDKFSGLDFGGVAKFQIEGEGAVMVDGTQSPPAVSPGDGDAAVTIIAAPDVFEEILSGSMNPTTAFMSGKLKIDGDMGMAMKLSSALA